MNFSKEIVLECKDSFTRSFSEKIDAAVVLGSGLSGHMEGLDIACEVPFASVKHMPVSGVAGHNNRFTVVRTAGKNVLFMLGRIHLYEGYSAFQTALAVAMLGELCVGEILLTNVCGGVNPKFVIGDIMAITDHINLQNASPLTGIGDSSRFLNMSAPYNTKFLKELQKQFRLKDGVYAGLAGPSYETPAEIKYLRSIGADAVGMSTVMETIMANYYGMNVYGLSVITNLAFSPKGQLSHNEVLETGKSSGGKLMEVISYLLKRIFA
jgi:purine-nucleoside phosphorylase